ncbi:MAG: ribulose-phosphate 3-epimerase [Thermodesulfobacteriota bacterium]|nr:ribulose-phosphate 3-epimerase [Thermodesulfobacteriota bacterium]
MNRHKAVIISPSLLSADFSRLGQEVSDVENAGADWLHVDVMDGIFVPNLTIGPLVVSAIKKVARIPLDVHLMIMDPGRYVADFQAAGADILHVHPEATQHLHRVLGQIREYGMKAGVALNPATSLEAIRHVLPELDVIMIMTVNPGFAGQAFIENMIPKVVALRDMLRESRRDIFIEVDGGVTPHNARRLIESGVNALVAGSAIFGHPPYADAIESLRH